MVIKIGKVMFQELISKSPTPLDIAAKNVTSNSPSSNNIKLTVSDNIATGLYKLVNCHFNAKTGQACVVKANSFIGPYCVFGAKFSMRLEDYYAITPFWFVWKGVTKTTGKDILFSDPQLKMYPFSAYEDTITIDVRCSSEENVYVGVGWWNEEGSRNSPVFAQVRQYEDQYSFFQPLKG